MGTRLWRSSLEGTEIGAPQDALSAAPASDGAVPVHFATPESARAHLDLLASDPLHLDRLRLALSARPDAGAGALSARADADVLGDLAHLLDRGALRADRRRGGASPPGITPDEPEPVKPKQQEERHEVEFEITDDFGDPVSDIRYTLTFPDGRKKDGTLGKDGRVKETGVPAGTYRLALRLVTAARWGASRVVVGEPVQLAARAPGFPEGTQGKFEIHDYRGLAGDTIATLDAAVGPTGALVAEWTPTREQVKAVAGGKVVFLARVGDAAALSPRAPVLIPHEIELKDDQGNPLPDTTLIAGTAGGYRATAQVKGGQAVVQIRAGDRIAWIDLPEHAGSWIKVEGDDVDAHELYLPDAPAEGGDG